MHVDVDKWLRTYWVSVRWLGGTLRRMNKKANFSSVLFNTLVKSCKHDGHICTFRTVMIDSLLQHTGALKITAGEANIIKVALL